MNILALLTERCKELNLHAEVKSAFGLVLCTSSSPLLVIPNKKFMYRLPIGLNLAKLYPDIVEEVKI